MRRNETVMLHAAPSAKVAATVIVRGCGKVILGEFVTVEDHVLLDAGSAVDSVIEIGARTKIKQGAILRTYDGAVRIGMRASIGEYTILAGHGGLQIGNTVIVGGHCYFSAADHIFEGDVAVRFQGETARGIVVGDGAWFGARCVVLDGVVVGRNCVIGAGSVLSQSLQGDTVCLGTPCREIRTRVPEEPIGW